MNIKNIKALVNIMENSNLSALEIVEGDTKIKIEKQAAVTAVNNTGLKNTVQYKAEQPIVNDIDETIDFNNITEVKSPLVGVFYAADSPEAAPLVTIGSKVKKGDPLCIVEAMKLMNEITAEQDGEIADVCVKNGDIVEFGQTLFKIF